MFHISFLKSQQLSYGVKTGISLIKYTFCHLKSKKILCHCLVSYTVSNTYKSSWENVCYKSTDIFTNISTFAKEIPHSLA